MVLAVAAVLAAGCTAGGTWVPAPVPPTGFDPGVRPLAMTEVSCASVTGCLAVGATTDGYGDGRVAVARWWDGATWRDVAGPPHVVRSLSCPAEHRCVGLDEDRHTAWSWDGSSWSSSVVDPTVRLSALSCGDPALCVAVGRAIGGLVWPAVAYRWDGSMWHDISIGSERPAGITWRDVDCPRGAGGCVVSAGREGADVTGPATAPWLERWDGTAWTSVPAAPWSGTSSVGSLSCVALDRCLLAARTSLMFVDPPPDRVDVLTFDAGTWSAATLPLDVAAAEYVGVNELSCPGPTTCLAVAEVRHRDQTTSRSLHRLDGASWVEVVAPSALPIDLSCPSAGFCAVAGGGGGEGPRVAVGDGRTWTVDEAVPRLPAPGTARLLDVSCVAAPGGDRLRCVAVGVARLRGEDQSLTAVWDGAGWHVVTVPGEAGDGVTLAGVSCPSVQTCTAVGSATGAGGGLRRVLWKLGPWAGGAVPVWRAVDLGGLAMGGLSRLDRVSCVAPDWCLAVGVGSAFVVQGGTWRATTAPPGVLRGVPGLSCLTPSRCLVHADQDHGVLVWNGLFWTETTSTVAGAPVGRATAVACVPYVSCVVLVDRPGEDGRDHTSSALWGDGTRLIDGTGPAPVDGSRLSCAAITNCVAVAGTRAASRWDGRGWQVIDPPGIEMADAALSCAAAGCARVGWRTISGPVGGGPGPVGEPVAQRLVMAAPAPVPQPGSSVAQ